MKRTDIAVFGGGCFWCTEAVFKMLKGVISVVPGYAGGPAERAQSHPAKRDFNRAQRDAERGGMNARPPTYAEVSTGATGHAEVIKIEYDPGQISYKTLLTVFFGTHDPTTLNRQGADSGTQYRSIILYTSEAQEIAAEHFVQELNASASKGKSIVTEVKPLTKFYEAEKYHRDYYDKNKEQPYCQVVINPKLKNVKKKFAALLNDIPR